MSSDDAKTNEALVRLLKDAGDGGQAKVDALVALSQQTVFVATWGGSSTGFRTLLNSSREAALPIFTSESELDTAARRYGWLDPQGNVSMREVGAREALHHAVAQEVAYVVVDIAADHSVEISPEEIEPLMSPAARRDSSGPFAVVGKVSDSVRKAVDSKLPPSMDGTGTGANPRVPAGPGAPTTGTTGTLPTEGLGTGPLEKVSLHAPPMMPEDATFDAVSEVLRRYPEVEWASIVGTAAQNSPLIGLRIDTAYRARVDEIVGHIKASAEATGVAVGTVLLDNAEVMRRARQEGVVFYPWRKR